MTRPKPAVTKPAARVRHPWIVAVPAAEAGLFLPLASFGVFPATSTFRRTAVFGSPEHWQITALGLAFLLAGVSVVIPERHRRLRVWVGRLSACSLLIGLAGTLFYRCNR